MILARSAIYAAILVSAILIVAKFIAWHTTNSMSIQASLMDSVLDAAASLVNFFVIKQAFKPADKEHRFGHGKAEALAAVAQAIFIAGSAVWFCLGIFDRLITPEPTTRSNTGIAIMILSSVLTFLLITWQRYVIRRTGSLVVNADYLHYQTDLLTNCAVIISLYFSGFTRLDPLIGLGIASYILHSSYKIARASLDMLMDRELSDEIRQRILDIALSNQMSKGVHDLRTRASGNQKFIQLHLDLPKDLSLWHSHEIAQTIENAIMKEFAPCEVIIHQDPV